MRRRLSLLLSLLFASLGRAKAQPLTTLQYHGQTFSLPRSYPDFRTYEKSHPHRFPETELVRIERAVSSAPFGPHFRDIESVVEALERLRFPGYGSFYANQLGHPESPGLEFMYVEVPERKRNRYLTVARDKGGFRVVADLVESASPELVRAARTLDGDIEFKAQNGKVVLRRRSGA